MMAEDETDLEEKSIAETILDDLAKRGGYGMFDEHWRERRPEESIEHYRTRMDFIRHGLFDARQ